MFPNSPSIGYLICGDFTCHLHICLMLHWICVHCFYFFEWYSLYCISSICININFQKPLLEWICNNIGKIFLYRFKSELGSSLQLASGWYPSPLFSYLCAVRNTGNDLCGKTAINLLSIDWILEEFSLTGRKIELEWNSYSILQLHYNCLKVIRKTSCLS